MNDRDRLAQLLDEADNRWQHGVGSSGYDPGGPPYWLADAVLADWVPRYRLEATAAVLAERERELLKLKGPCSTSECCLHYAHAGPCDIKQTYGGTVETCGVLHSHVIPCEVAHP